MHFATSSLATHCEVLFIKVQNRGNIRYLINSLPHLRSLILQSRDDNWNYASSTNDHSIQWLQHNLPPTCSVQRDSRFIHHLRIWVHS
jgi:hypothetical protein